MPAFSTHDRDLVNARGGARGRRAVGTRGDQRVGFYRHTVLPVALIIAIEQLPRRLTVKGNMHLVLSAFKCGEAKVGGAG
jgi:hypothetical protein